jgi:two-component system response regulator DevR
MHTESVLNVALLDDHPAVLAGLRRLIEPEPDLTVTAAARSANDLTRRLDGRRVDVIVLDYDLARGDGLSLCRRLKSRAEPPGVIIYSAYASPALSLAARAAGADGVVDKSEPVPALLAAIRAVARGETHIPSVPPDAHQAAAARLDDEDLPILALLLDGEPVDGIAQAFAQIRARSCGAGSESSADCAQNSDPIRSSRPRRAAAPGRHSRGRRSRVHRSQWR